MLNDICACGWQYYTAYYLKNIVKLDKGIVATAFFVGQLVDGFGGLAVGFVSDKCNTPWGKRLPWFIAGTVVCYPSFVGIYAYPPFIVESDS